ncbi:hypothetical protein SFRURICE_017637 [Spodoptera frugiperda]|nr:hypothetical protein SFRURICE_017637 [Spodoptera frugiperda]
MYTLLHGFYKYLVQKDEYCVLILGLDNAGKTTYLEATKTKFTKKYKAMNPNRITTTVGLNIGKIDVDGVRLNFWDLGGQQELQSLWDKYYAECHAVIYIVDSSDRDRISESKETFDCMGVHTVKPIFNQNAHLIGARDIMLMAISALNGDGVDEGIRWLVDCIKRNNVDRPPRNHDDNL